MPDTYDAVVIGGGPAGSTTAFLLARAGWSVALIEQTRFPRAKVCGEFISATTFPLLRLLNLDEAYLELAGPEITRLALFSGRHQLTAEMPRLNDGNRGWGRALGREHLDSLLLDRAAATGVRLFQPWTVVSFASVRDGFKVTIASPNRDSRHLNAALIVAAHGSWSGGRLPSEPPRHQPRHSDLFGFKAHFRHAHLRRGTMPLLAFRGGYGGMVQTDDGRLSLSCCVRRDQLEQLRAVNPRLSAGEAVLQHIVATTDGARETLDGAVRENEWRAAGPIRPGIRGTGGDRIFLVGNAAAEAHPVVAEGISMAIQSGWALAHALTSDPNVDSARRRYARLWRRLFARRIYTAAAIAHWAMRPAAVAMLMPVLRRFPRTLTEGARSSGKVTAVCLSSF